MKKILFPALLLLFCITAVAQDYASRSFSDKVIKSFSEGDNPDFNRSAISVIKCAIATFGLNDVLKKIEPVPGGLLITLRNNETLQLSSTELAYAKSKCRFKLMGEEKIFDKSILLYSILAKRAINNSDPLFSYCKDLKSALAFLHGGAQPVSVISLVPLLGFNYIEVREYSEICYVHQNGQLAVFACYQNFDDDGYKHKLDAVHWSNHAGTKNPKVLENRNIILANFIPPVTAMQ